MNSGNQNLSLSEAAVYFIAKLSPEEKETSQREIYEFVRWFGSGRPLAGLTAFEVANYAERLSASDTDYLKKIELVRAFLVYAKKQGWSETNLATHFKAKKGQTKLRTSSQRGTPEIQSLTRQGYAKLEAELAALKSKRLQAIEEMHRAAADKDFRENAPLEAAREQHGYLVGQIRELEAALKSAIIIDEEPKKTPKVSIGDSIVLRDLDSGEELSYMIVSPKEGDPAKGKISSASPMGKAIIGRGLGDIVEVVTPNGKLCYQIKQDSSPTN